MAARRDHRRQGDRRTGAARAGRAPDVAAFAARTGAPPGPGDRARRRRPGVGRLRREQAARRAREVGHRRLPPRTCPPTRRARRSSPCSSELNADPARQRDPAASCPLPEHLDGAALTRADRRPTRTSTGSRRSAPAAWRSGAPGLRPCTPVGRDRAARPRRRARWRAPRRSSSAARTSFGKPMAQLLLGANATVTDLPLAHPRPAGASARAPTCWSPPSAVPRMVGADWVKPGAAVIDVGINRDRGRPRRRRRLRRRARGRRRDHAGARRRRPDDDRDAAAQHA